MPRIFHRRLAIVALSGLLALTAPAPAFATVEIRTVEPRAFGHTLGDTVERRLTIVMPHPLALAEESLPKKGRINAGLELSDIAVERHEQPGATRHELRLRYQIFAAPQQVKAVSLPAVSLKLKGAAGPENIDVAAWPIFVAPLVAEPFVPSSGLGAMRPDVPPPTIETGWLRLRLAVFGLLTLLLGGTLAYRRFADLLPGRRPAPFAAAYRDLRRLAGDPSAAAFHRGLKRLHRAFDEAAGGAVFAEDLERFLAAHPRYLGAGPAIRDFFARSRREFFAPGAGPVEPDMPWLIAVCRECRRREAGGA